MVRIAPVLPEDRADWLELWAGYLTFYETVLKEAITELTFERLLDPNSGIHGAIARDDAGAAIGFVHWLFHPASWSRTGYCYLEDLFVAPGSRGSGAGRALIAHVREEAATQGAAKVYWLTEESNSTARALYDRVAVRSGFIHYEIDIDEG